MHVALAFNPSPLRSSVRSVVEGSVRARQDLRMDPIGTVVAGGALLSSLAKSRDVGTPHGSGNASTTNERPRLRLNDQLVWRGREDDLAQIKALALEQ